MADRKPVVNVNGSKTELSVGDALEVFGLKLRNTAGTFLNTFANATTAARTWTFPDKDGTFAMTSDIAGGGKIVDITQLVVTTPSSQSLVANTIADITNMTITLTPASPTSRFKVDVYWFGEYVSPNNMMFGLRRNSVGIGAAAQIGSRNFGFVVPTISFSNDGNSTPEVASFSYIDSPATASNVTYTVTARCSDIITTLYNNRTISDVNSSTYERGTSTITVTELSS